MRRNQAQESQQKTQNGALTTRAEISFPTSAVMDDDVVWRRDIYRELDLMDNANAGLYYPVEPTDGKMNFFTYIFKLMLSGRVPAYEYRLDGNELFNDSSRIKPLAFLDNYHIYYERNGNRLHLVAGREVFRRVAGADLDLTRGVLETCIDLLGFSAPERM